MPKRLMDGFWKPNNDSVKEFKRTLRAAAKDAGLK